MNRSWRFAMPNKNEIVQKLRQVVNDQKHIAEGNVRQTAFLTPQAIGYHTLDATFVKSAQDRKLGG